MTYWPVLCGLRRKITSLREGDGGVANNKGAYHTAHPCNLISAFVIHLLESIISRLATSEISIFLLVSVAEQTSLNLTPLEATKTNYLAQRPMLY